MASVKGHQGFLKTYKKLGATKTMRVPELVYEDIKSILILLEQISQKRGADHTHKLLKGMVNVLESSNV
jgi:hypothetical protein